MKFDLLVFMACVEYNQKMLDRQSLEVSSLEQCKPDVLNSTCRTARVFLCGRGMRVRAARTKSGRSLMKSCKCRYRLRLAVPSSLAATFLFAG